MFKKILLYLIIFLPGLSSWAMEGEKELSLYEILGVGEKASPEEIKKSYKKLALKWHPDKWDRNKNVLEQEGYTKESAEEKYKVIKEAFDILNDPIIRKEYDTGIPEGASSPEELLELMKKASSWFKRYPQQTIYEFFNVRFDADISEIESKYENLTRPLLSFGLTIEMKEQPDILKKAELAIDIMRNARFFYNAKLQKILKKNIRMWLKHYPNETPFEVLGVSEGEEIKIIEDKYNQLVQKAINEDDLKKLAQAKEIAKEDKWGFFSEIKTEYGIVKQFKNLNELIDQFHKEEVVPKKIKIIKQIIKETEKYNFDETSGEVIEKGVAPLHEIWKDVKKEVILVNLLKPLIEQMIHTISLDNIQQLNELISIAENKFKLWKKALNTNERIKQFPEELKVKITTREDYKDALKRYNTIVQEFEKKKQLSPMVEQQPLLKTYHLYQQPKKEIVSPWIARKVEEEIVGFEGGELSREESQFYKHLAKEFEKKAKTHELKKESELARKKEEFLKHFGGEVEIENLHINLLTLKNKLRILHGLLTA